MSLSYRDSGVDLDKYEQSMQRLPRWMHRTFSPRVVRNDGGFAGLYSLDFANSLFSRNYQEPILVSGTDGVGTKLKVAMMADRHDTVGIDLVAMCVNDVLCTGAEPLFFLDYVAMSHDDPIRLEQIVSGVSEGCVQSDCSLLGGETAIMPDLYGQGDYDLAGFCVGVVDRKHLITGKTIQPGDVVVGVASSGLHSNGYSLVRKIVFEAAGLELDASIDELGETVGECLLRPTQIYAALVRQVLGHYKVKNIVHGIAHITGGGLLENTERILPSNIDLQFTRHGWDQPAVFPWLQKLGNVDADEMDRVFNMGIGLTFIVNPFYLNTVETIVRQLGLKCWTIGEAIEGQGKSVWK
jgi:phosphoribosylformylglycinamidine cyclo-ligase